VQPLYPQLESIDSKVLNASFVGVGIVEDFRLDTRWGRVWLKQTLKGDLRARVQGKLRNFNSKSPSSTVLVFARDGDTYLDLIRLDDPGLKLSTADFHVLSDAREIVQYILRIASRAPSTNDRQNAMLQPPENEIGEKWKQAYGEKWYGGLLVPVDERLERYALRDLRSKVTDRRVAAAHLLGLFKSRGTIARLKSLLNDRSSIISRYADWNEGVEERLYVVREAAYQSLRAMGVAVEMPLTTYGRRLASADGFILPAKAACPRLIYRLAPPSTADWTTWHGDRFTGALQWSRTPSGRDYFGPFGQQYVRLHLDRLPRHKNVRIEVELFVIGSWDGNGGLGAGPDILDVHVLSMGKLMHSTFFNNTEGDAANLLMQSFPDPFPPNTATPQDLNTESAQHPSPHPGYTGAAEIRSLGFTEPWAGVVYHRDAVYKLSWTFAHDRRDLDLTFTGQTVPQPIIDSLEADEHWGIGRLRISTD
jgi:hypothetical protein